MRGLVRILIGVAVGYFLGTGVAVRVCEWFPDFHNGFLIMISIGISLTIWFAHILVKEKA